MSLCFLLQSILGVLFLIPADVESLIDLFSFTIWLFYSFTFTALIIMRFVKPYSEFSRPYKVNVQQVIEDNALFAYFNLASLGIDCMGYCNTHLQYAALIK